MWGRGGGMRLAARTQDCVRVHLASRDVLTIAGLKQLMKPCAFVMVTGTSASEQATLAAIRTDAPDVLVISATEEREIHMLALAARTVDRDLKIVALADEKLASVLATTAQTRLEGVLVRGGDHLEDIAAVLRIVHRGGRVTSEYREAVPVPAAPAVSPQLAARLGSLTGRETVILQDLARGRTNAQIAQPLHVSVATIKADITNIMRVLGAAGRVELAVLAVQCGLVGLDSISSAAGDPAQRDRRSDGVGQLA